MTSSGIVVVLHQTVWCPLLVFQMKIWTVAQRYYISAMKKRFFGIHKSAKSAPSSASPVESADLVHQLSKTIWLNSVCPD